MGGTGGGRPPQVGGGSVHCGQVRTFNQEKGFGFISCHAMSVMFGKTDVFLHYTEALSFQVSCGPAAARTLAHARLWLVIARSRAW